MTEEELGCFEIDAVLLEVFFETRQVEIKGTGASKLGASPLNFKLINVKEDGSRGGFWGAPPAFYQDVLKQAEGKTFFNFDDPAFGELIARFLRERFPERSRFEAT